MCESSWILICVWAGCSERAQQGLGFFATADALITCNALAALTQSGRYTRCDHLLAPIWLQTQEDLDAQKM